MLNSIPLITTNGRVYVEDELYHTDNKFFTHGYDRLNDYGDDNLKVALPSFLSAVYLDTHILLDQNGVIWFYGLYTSLSNIKYMVPVKLPLTTCPGSNIRPKFKNMVQAGSLVILVDIDGKVWSFGSDAETIFGAVAIESKNKEIVLVPVSIVENPVCIFLYWCWTETDEKPWSHSQYSLLSVHENMTIRNYMTCTNSYTVFQYENFPEKVIRVDRDTIIILHHGKLIRMNSDGTRYLLKLNYMGIMMEEPVFDIVHAGDYQIGICFGYVVYATYIFSFYEDEIGLHDLGLGFPSSEKIKGEILQCMTIKYHIVVLTYDNGLKILSAGNPTYNISTQIDMHSYIKKASRFSRTKRSI